MLGYAFVDLDAEQLRTRRNLLDKAGLTAYLTTLFVPLAIYVFRRYLKNTLDPIVFGPRPERNAFQDFARKLCWKLGFTKVAEFGPLHVQVVGLLYASWLMYLIVRGTGDDYMHVTKAFGLVGVSQLPILSLLAFKYSPLTFATGLTHEHLNAYHRMLARIVHVLLATHAMLYLNFFIAKGLLVKRLGDRDVRAGLIAFGLLNLLGILALPRIRNKFYHRLFYRSHVVLTAVIPLILFLHVPSSATTFVAQAFSVVSFNYTTRHGKSTSVKVTSRSLTGDLVEVKAVAPAGYNARWRQWTPGMHAYLYQDGALKPRAPFSVVNVDYDEQGDTVIKFVIRNLGGPATSLLTSEAAKDDSATWWLEGPYGQSEKYMPALLRANADPTEKILVVAGGIGATYALPIYSALQSNRGRQSSHLKFMWLVKQDSELTWGLEYLLSQNDEVNATLFVTRGTKSGNEHDQKIRARAYQDLRVESRSGRSSFDWEVQLFFAQEKEGILRGNVTVIVCGPRALASSVRRVADQHVMGTGVGVDWYDEQFGFGGS